MITDSNVQFFFNQMNTIAGKVYQDVPVHHPQFTTTLPVETETWKTGWIGLMDKMRVWDGPRVTKEPAPQTYSVTPKPFEQTRKLDRFRFDDDMLGIYADLPARMAREAKMLPDYELRDLIQNTGNWTGGFQNGWDGLTFFHTAHNVDLYDASKGTYSNSLGSGQSIGGVTVGGALTGPGPVATLYEYIQSIKGEDGESLQLQPTHILIPAALQVEANLICKSAFMAPPAWGGVTLQVGAADNPMLRFGLEPIVWPLLDTNSKSIWYMLCNNHALKPFLWLQRQAPVFTYIVNEQSQPVFGEHSYLWGAWARAAPAWSASWLAYKSGT